MDINIELNDKELIMIIRSLEVDLENCFDYKIQSLIYNLKAIKNCKDKLKEDD